MEESSQSKNLPGIEFSLFESNSASTNQGNDILFYYNPSEITSWTESFYLDCYLAAKETTNSIGFKYSTSYIPVTSSNYSNFYLPLLSESTSIPSLLTSKVISKSDSISSLILTKQDS